MSNVNFVQLQKNIEEYGVEAAMSWATQFPDTINKPLIDAFSWYLSKEGDAYWSKVVLDAEDRKQTNSTSSTPPQDAAPTTQANEADEKVLPFEEEILRRLAERKATNLKNKALHDKALELADASKKKLAKKLLKLMKDNKEETVVSSDSDNCPF